MEQLPTFSNENPVIASAPLDPKGEGNIKIANMIGAVSHKIVGDVVSVRKAVSNAALFSQSSIIDNARRDAQTQIYLNPGNSSQIANNFNQNIAAVAKNVELSGDDREKLKLLQGSASNVVNNSALLANGKHIRLTQALNFRSDLPNQLSSINQNLHDSPIIAQTQIENLLKMNQDGFNNGFVSPSEYINVKKSVDGLINRHAQMTNLIGSGNASVDELHALHSIPGENNSNLPTYPSTYIKYSNTAQQLSKSDIISDLHNGKLDGGAAALLSPADFNDILNTAHGINLAQSHINSGNSYQLISHQFNYLNTLPSSQLTTTQKAERDQYASYIKNINNGNMLPALKQTSLGAKIFDQFNASTQSIKLNGSLSDDEKQKLYNNEFSNFTNRMVSLAHSINIPQNKINPVPFSISGPLNEMYNINQDPSAVIGTLNKYSENNAVYLANSLKNPVQQESLMLVNGLRGKNANEFQKILISATQKGRDFSDIRPNQGITDNTIKSDLMSNNSKYFKYVEAQPNGANRINNILKAGVSYIKLRSQQSSDLSISDLSDYENEFSQNIKKSSSLDTGSNFVFDSNKIQLTHAQASSVANYLTEETKQDMLKNNTQTQVNSILGLSPLRVTNTPDGNLIIMNDRNSQIGKKVLLSDDLIKRASNWEALQPKTILGFPILSKSKEESILKSKLWNKLHFSDNTNSLSNDVKNASLASLLKKAGVNK